MYLAFFGLNEKPFAITPDPRYLFLGERHAEALAHLVYGITEAGGFIQLTGEVGTGKTTVVRSLLGQIPASAEVALILNPQMTAPEFLLTICEEIGIGVNDSAQGSVKELVDILNHYLLRAHADGRRVVLVVDEAQNLDAEVLEQVRLLTNLETETRKLLQIILIGQPELRELLARTELRQLAQRVTGRYHLDPLEPPETAAYVRHRLRIAGATREIFSPGALNALHRRAGGIPRLINVIADRALLGAFTQDRHLVTANLVRRASEEVFGRKPTPRWIPWAAVGGSAALLAVSGIALWEWSNAGAGTPAGGTAHAAAAAAAPASARTTAAPVAASALQSTPLAAPPVATAPPVPAAPPAPLLGDLLSRFQAETDTDTAFSRLFALWGAQYVAGNVDPCAQATQKGLECLVQRGSLAQLRQYNRPAILTVSDDAGAPRQVVLTGLDDDHAFIDLGGGRQPVSIGNLTRYWFGDYVLLWRPGSGHGKPLALGARGADVRWLRESLERLAGNPPTQPVSDVYDPELVKAVQSFQREHRLAVDGIAGVQTQILVDAALGSADSPFLAVDATAAANPPHGG
jgi:general secretion pathway protein A